MWATGWADSILDPVVHRLTHRMHIPDRPPPWATTSRRNPCAILRSLFSLVFLEMALMTLNIFNSQVQLTRFYLAIYKPNFRYPYIAYGKGYQHVWFHSDEMSKRDKSETESPLATARSQAGMQVGEGCGVSFQNVLCCWWPNSADHGYVCSKWVNCMWITCP